MCSVFALVLVLSGCGGQKAEDEDLAPGDAIATAATAMADAGSARINGSTLLEIRTQDGETVEAEIPGIGVADFRAGKAHVIYDMSDLAGPGAEMEQIFESPVFYSKLPSRHLPPGKWVKVDPEALAASGVDPSRVSDLTRHPAPVLDYLEAVEDVEEVGGEDVAGVETVRYRGTLKGSAERSTESEIPVEFWIDSDGLVRRMRFEFTSTLLATGNEASTSQTIEFSEFGVTVDVEPPPSSEVVPIETLLEEAEGQP